MSHIVLVRKIKADGQPCRKCCQVIDRLHAEGLMDRIDRVVIADARDPESEGMQLARQYGVDRAPFFLVTDDLGETRLYTVFLRFLHKVLKRPQTSRERLLELQELGDGLEFI